MSRGNLRELIRLLSFLIAVAILATIGYSVLVRRPLLNSLSQLLFLEGGILLIVFSLSMSRSLQTKYRDKEMEEWERTLGAVSILKASLILLLGSFIISFLIDFL
jgi:sulfite exporter TauE/SafE